MHTCSLRSGLLAAAAAVAFGAAFAPPAAAQTPGSQPHDVHDDDDVEVLIVQATRSRRRVQDEPIRVEVINREEIEEKILMTPGNISTLLAETGGVRVQVTSPALGASSVRMQGMRGRYTLLLADGLPIYGGQASSLGLLQIPPSDLGQVEVIKGAASALYGPAALGGVINLVSRRPKTTAETEIVANLTSRDGQDLTVYAATPGQGGWSYSVTGGAHHQALQDLDADGWADMAAFERATLRPRAFWIGEGASAYVTLGFLDEKRQGGTLPGAVAPDGSPFAQDQDTRRLDGGVVFEAPLEGLGLMQLRASGVSQRHEHRYGVVVENDHHETLFAEASVGGGDRTTWLVGAAIQRDAYRNRTFAAFDYAFTTPALFAQAEHVVNDDLTLAGSARFDDHSRYGAQLSPRVSLLYRPGPWTIRASLGRGFYAPTPFIEEIEAAGLSRLIPPADLVAETAKTASLEGGYAAGPFEANLTLFGSAIDNAVQLQIADATPGAETVRLVNAAGTTRTSGAEVLLRYRWNDVTVTGSYVYVDASEPDPSGIGRRITPITPRQTAGLVAMWENHEKGRVGLEVYYTGAQSLDGNPYRATSRPYVEVGFMMEKVVGKARVFINLENILDVRQTDYDPILLPRRGAAGQWTVDAWAPAEGRVINGGIRVRFGGT